MPVLIPLVRVPNVKSPKSTALSARASPCMNALVALLAPKGIPLIIAEAPPEAPTSTASCPTC